MFRQSKSHLGKKNLGILFHKTWKQQLHPTFLLLFIRKFSLVNFIHNYFITSISSCSNFKMWCTNFRTIVFCDVICLDIDECLNAMPCSTADFEKCSNTYGSYTCVCQTGYYQIDNVCTRKYYLGLKIQKNKPLLRIAECWVDKTKQAVPYYFSFLMQYVGATSSLFQESYQCTNKSDNVSSGDPGCKTVFENLDTHC